MAGSLEPEVGEKGRLLLARQLGDLGFDDGGDPADGRARAPGDLLEPEALDERLAAVDLLLGEVQAVQDRLLREEGEAAERPRVVLGRAAAARIGVSDSSAGLEALQDRLLLDVGVRALLLDRRLEALEPALHHLEVGEDQLGLEIGDVALGIGRRARRVGERAHHVQERVGVPELLGVESLAVALGDPGEVYDLERREGRLLRLEERGQPVHALVGHARHARVHLRARAAERRGRQRRAGQQVEQRGLSALGKPDQTDLHGASCYHSASCGRGASAPSERVPARRSSWSLRIALTMRRRTVSIWQCAAARP